MYKSEALQRRKERFIKKMQDPEFLISLYIKQRMRILGTKE